jgi:hypothetical protein
LRLIPAPAARVPAKHADASYKQEATGDQHPNSQGTAEDAQNTKQTKTCAQKHERETDAGVQHWIDTTGATVVIGIKLMILPFAPGLDRIRPRFTLLVMLWHCRPRISMDVIYCQLKQAACASTQMPKQQVGHDWLDDARWLRDNSPPERDRPKPGSQAEGIAPRLARSGMRTFSPLLLGGIQPELPKQQEEESSLIPRRLRRLRCGKYANKRSTSISIQHWEAEVNDNNVIDWPHSPASSSRRSPAEIFMDLHARMYARHRSEVTAR